MNSLNKGLFPWIASPAGDNEGGVAVVEDLPGGAGVGDLAVGLDGPGGGRGRQGEVDLVVVGHARARRHHGAARPTCQEWKHVRGSSDAAFISHYHKCHLPYVPHKHD